MPNPPRAPQLSVIVPCRDSEDVLEVQLAALAKQECPEPWELLICDNGSSDGTVALAQSWADRLPLRVIDASAVPGAGPARNAGVREARGEWIGFCDADDEVAEGWLVTLCEELAHHPFIAGGFEATRLNSPRTLRSRALDQQDGLQHSPSVVGLPHAGGSNLGIRREVFLEVGGFDPAVRYLEDTDLCWRVQLAGYSLVFVPRLQVHLRLRSTLRTMYRQGRNFGASQANLERRYAGAAEWLLAGAVSNPGTPREPGAVPVLRSECPDAEATGDSTGPDPATEAVGPIPGRVGTVSRMALGGLRLTWYFITQRSSIGAQAWQLGWHVGHRGVKQVQAVDTRGGRPLLVRESALGGFEGASRRPGLVADPKLHRARWGLLPLSSVVCVRTADRVLALTYDDGPDPAETAELLDALVELGARATFFVLSDRAEANPEIIRRMLREGHEVEVHGMDHADLTSVSGVQAVRRIWTAKGRVQKVTGHRVRYYRPTYGALNLAGFLGARLARMDVVIWSAWARDWIDAPPQEVADRALDALHPGAILLLHDTTDVVMSTEASGPVTFSRADVSRRILEGAGSHGYSTLPLGELLRRYPAVRSLTVRRPRNPVRGVTRGRHRT